MREGLLDLLLYQNTGWKTEPTRPERSPEEPAAETENASEEKQSSTENTEDAKTEPMMDEDDKESTSSKREDADQSDKKEKNNQEIASEMGPGEISVPKQTEGNENVPMSGVNESKEANLNIPASVAPDNMYVGMPSLTQYESDVMPPPSGFQPPGSMPGLQQFQQLNNIRGVAPIENALQQQRPPFRPMGSIRGGAPDILQQQQQRQQQQQQPFLPQGNVRGVVPVDNIMMQQQPPPPFQPQGSIRGVAPEMLQQEEQNKMLRQSPPQQRPFEQFPPNQPNLTRPMMPMESGFDQLQQTQSMPNMGGMDFPHLQDENVKNVKQSPPQFINQLRHQRLPVPPESISQPRHPRPLVPPESISQPRHPRPPVPSESGYSQYQAESDLMNPASFAGMNSSPQQGLNVRPVTQPPSQQGPFEQYPYLSMSDSVPQVSQAQMDRIMATQAHTTLAQTVASSMPENLHQRTPPLQSDFQVRPGIRPSISNTSVPDDRHTMGSPDFLPRIPSQSPPSFPPPQNVPDIVQSPNMSVPFASRMPAMQSQVPNMQPMFLGQFSSPPSHSPELINMMQGGLPPPQSGTPPQVSNVPTEWSRGYQPSPPLSQDLIDRPPSGPSMAPIFPLSQLPPVATGMPYDVPPQMIQQVLTSTQEPPGVQGRMQMNPNASAFEPHTFLPSVSVANPPPVSQPSSDAKPLEIDTYQPGPQSQPQPQGSEALSPGNHASDTSVHSSGDDSEKPSPALIGQISQITDLCQPGIIFGSSVATAGVTSSRFPIVNSKDAEEPVSPTMPPAVANDDDGMPELEEAVSISSTDPAESAGSRSSRPISPEIKEVAEADKKLNALNIDIGAAERNLSPTVESEGSLSPNKERELEIKALIEMGLSKDEPQERSTWYSDTSSKVGSGDQPRTTATQAEQSYGTSASATSPNNNNQQWNRSSHQSGYSAFTGVTPQQDTDTLMSPQQFSGGRGRISRAKGAITGKSPQRASNSNNNGFTQSSKDLRTPQDFEKGFIPVRDNGWASQSHGKSGQGFQQRNQQLKGQRSQGAFSQNQMSASHDNEEEDWG